MSNLFDELEKAVNEGDLEEIMDNPKSMIGSYCKAFIEANEYNVLAVGYDPYNAKVFIEQRWISENGPYGVEKVIQGKKTESVPLKELKKLAEARLLIFDEALMTFTMGNCIAESDNNGNIMLTKPAYDAKIDNVAALLDAYVAYKINKEAFD